jgi:broad specificity phosphatase PhoE
MTRILLIRHGHTELLGKVLYGRMPGIHLSEQGRSEIQKLAAGLKARYRVDEVLSSPLERARETAEAIAPHYSKTVLLDEDLQEVDFGNWMGKPFAKLMNNEAWKRYNRYRSLNGPPGGEFMNQVQLRSWNALERAIERHRQLPEPTIAVVSHGDVVRALLMLFLGMPLDNIHRLEISTASVSEVVIGNAYPQVITVNQSF